MVNTFFYSALNISNYQINNVRDSKEHNGIVTRGYIDTQLGLKLSTTGDEMHGQLSMENNRIIKISEAIGDDDAVNFRQMPAAVTQDSCFLINPIEYLMESDQASLKSGSLLIKLTST